MKQIKQFIILLLICLSNIQLSAQEESEWEGKPEVKIYGFAETFYAYDLRQPDGNQIQPFLTTML